jgi:AcrR family transcriptional regulator
MEDSIVDLFKSKLINNEKMTDKQRKILEASIDLFSEKGFANTSTSEIAKKAGVAEGTIFKHFGSKDNLLIATITPFIVNDVFPEMALQFTEHTLSSEYMDFRSFVQAFIKDRLTFVNENYKIAKIFITEIMYKEETRIKLISLIPSELKTSLDKLLDNFKSTNQIVNWPNPTILRFIITNIAGYAFTKFMLFPSPIWKDEAEIEYMTELLTKGLAPKTQ